MLETFTARQFDIGNEQYDIGTPDVVFRKLALNAQRSLRLNVNAPLLLQAELLQPFGSHIGMCNATDARGHRHQMTSRYHCHVHPPTVTLKPSRSAS